MISDTETLQTPVKREKPITATPAVQRPKVTRTPTALKHQSLKSTPVALTTRSVKSESSDILIIDDSNNVDDLPEFAHADWVPRFLPTLYHVFGCSEKPWELFTKGNAFVMTLQTVVDAVYPGTSYRVKWGDKICSMVSDNLPYVSLMSNILTCLARQANASVTSAAILDDRRLRLWPPT